MTEPAHNFYRSAEFRASDGVVERLRPRADIHQVVIDPLRQFGEPVVRSVPTEVIAEQIRAGERSSSSTNSSPRRYRPRSATSSSAASPTKPPPKASRDDGGRSSRRLFVDESALGLGKALAVARRDVVHTGHPLVPEIPVGTIDPDWIPAVAARELAVIARDRRIRTKPGELELLRQHRLRVFWIAGKKDGTTWDWLVRIVRRWNDIEDVLANQGPGPRFMAINAGEVKEIGV